MDHPAFTSGFGRKVNFPFKDLIGSAFDIPRSDKILTGSRVENTPSVQIGVESQ
jgi:hypothetical protein